MRCFGRHRRRRISIHERLFLNPFDKWTRFGFFPTKFALHVLLLILVTYQVMSYLRKDIKHACHTGQHFSMLFLGAPEGSTMLMQPKELQRDFLTAVHNVFFLNDVTFNDVYLVVNHVPNPATLPILVRLRNQSSRIVDLSRSAFLAAEPAGAEEYLRRALPELYGKGIRHLQELSMGFSIVETMHHAPRAVGARPTKGRYDWDLLVQFDGSHVGKFVGRLSYKMGTDILADDYSYALNIWIMVLATVGLALIARRILQTFQILLTIRRQVNLSRAQLSQETSALLALSWKEEMALFNWWWAVSALCHVLQLAATANCMRVTRDVTNRFALLGWSCFLTWLNICQYYESFPGYYVTFSTTSKGMASVCRYMASVVPILTAFMFLGTCNFWKASTFQDVSASYASLFSLLNGDMVHDAFEELGGIGGWAGSLYLYVFIFIFIYIVLSVNITLIEEAYYAARFHGLRHEQQAELAAQHSWPGDPASTAFGCSTQQVSRPHLKNVASYELLPGPDAFSPADNTPRSMSFARSLSQGAVPLPDVNGGVLGLAARGSMSPRILDNPRLAGALSAAFPLSLHEVLTESPARHPTAAFAAPNGHMPTHPNVDWWLAVLPHWTKLLHSMPFPRRGEVGDEQRWQELEQCVAAHTTAIHEASASLYREALRT